MLTSFNAEFRKWIVTKSAPVGKFIDFVIDPESGTFEALWVKTPKGLRLVAPGSVSMWNKNEIEITSEDELMKAEDFPRITSILEREVPILKAPVFLGEECLGRVYNFAFDTISPRLLSLSVSKGWGPWKVDRIINRSKIEKITKDGIFVTDSKIKKSEEEIPRGVSLPEAE